MKFRTLVVGSFSLLLVAAAWVTLFGDCIRQQFAASSEALAGVDTVPTSEPTLRKNLSTFGGDEVSYGSPTIAATRSLAVASHGTVTAPPSETGQLTAGDWDDNLNYDYFLSFSQRFHSAHPGYAALDLKGRTILSVRNERGEPVAGARVLVSSANRQRTERITPADGRIQLFHALDRLGAQAELVVVPPRGEIADAVRASIPPLGGEMSVVLRGVRRSRPAELDLAFVLDTTGSMGDELAYLKSELERISASVGRAFPDVKVRYALVAYRDVGDQYVTRSVDFSKLPAFREQLAPFSAGGGGDEPEAMDRAAGALTGLSWHPGSAKVAFLIADAPAHPENAHLFLSGVDAARRLGIRIYSLAASDVRDPAEFLLRSASQLTLGRYLFLTDDSGVGNSHAEPHIPCYQVQRLSTLMAGVIQSELSGRHEEPAPQDIVRTVGNPVGGTCRAEVAARAPSNQLRAQ